MILVTVGTQIPFDRLIKYVDQWVDEFGFDLEVVAQIGSSDLKCRNFPVFKSVEPALFEEYIEKCDFLISHAGMGSILTALRVKKPIIIFPRSASLGEHRNEHQLATSRSFSNVDGVYVAETKEDLYRLLSDRDQLVSGVLNDSEEYKSLISNLSLLIG